MVHISAKYTSLLNQQHFERGENSFHQATEWLQNNPPCLGILDRKSGQEKNWEAFETSQQKEE